MASGSTFAQYHPQPVQFIEQSYSTVSHPSEFILCSVHQLTLPLQPNMEQYYQGSNGVFVSQPANYQPADSIGAGAQFNAAPQNDTSGHHIMSPNRSSQLNNMGTFDTAAAPQGPASVPNGMGLQASTNTMAQGSSDCTDDHQAWLAEVRVMKARVNAFRPKRSSRGQYPRLLSVSMPGMGPRPNTNTTGQASSAPLDPEYVAELRVMAARLSNSNGQGSSNLADPQGLTGMPTEMVAGSQAGIRMGQVLNNPLYSQGFPAMSNGTASARQTNLSFIGQGAYSQSVGQPINQPIGPTPGFKNYNPDDYNRAPPRQQNSSGRKRSASPSFDFVMEDPSRQQEKRARLSEEDEQKLEEYRLMKDMGGSCLWCYRNKKKCGPKNPCLNCESNGYQCIRDHTQLCLSSSTSNATGTTTTGNQGMIDVFRSLRDTAMQSTPNARINVNFRQPGTQKINVWPASLPQAEPYSPGYVNEKLIHTVLSFIQSPELDRIGKETERHPLVQSASAMLKLLAAIKCLLNARVYVRPSDADAGRITVFYMLTACVQILQQESEVFTSKLCDAVRRSRSSPKPCTDGRDTSPSPTKKPLKPIWAATGFYYRVIEGLLSIKEPSPLLEKVLGDVSNLHGLPSNVWSVLRWLPLFDKVNGKIEVHEALRDHIPVIEEQWPLDIALLPDVGVQQLPPTAMNRLAEPFSGLSYDMGSFLEDKFDFLGGINQVDPEPVDWDAFVDLEASEPSGPSEAFQSSEPSTVSFEFSEPYEQYSASDDFLDTWKNVDEVDGSDAAYCS